MRRIVARLNHLEELTLTLTLLCLAAVAFVQVCTRYLLGISFDWFEEGGRYLGVFVTFLGAGIGVKRGSHFALDAVVSSLRPSVAKALRVAVGVFSGCVFLLIAWYGFKIVGRNYRFEVNSAAIGAPMYLVYLPIPVLSALIGTRFFLAAAKLLGAQAAAGGE